MKETIKKIILIVTLIALSIFQTNVVFALSEEVKREVDYQDGKTNEYNIKIDGSDLTSDIKIPSIEFSLEDVLYEKKELTDIDFFDTSNLNNNLMWLRIKTIVTKGLSTVLYVCLALMLTFIIYIGLDIVIDSISNSKDESENETKNKRKGRFRSVASKLKNKKGAEQWITCFISLGLVVFVLNILITLSETIINGLNFVEPQEQKIKVYVENVAMAETTITETVSNLIFLGDLRTRQMETAVSSSYVFVAKESQGYDWMIQSGFQEVEERIRRGTKVIIWLGVNDLFNADLYIDAINQKATEWASEGVQIAFATVGPATVENYEEEIPEFNDKLKEGLSDSIQIIDVYEFLMNKDEGKVKFRESDKDEHLHYKDATSKMIYDYMVDQALNGKGSKNTVTKIQDFSFITNAEGLCVFQTNHSWAKHASMNFRYLVYAGCLVISRTVVYIAYIVRMILIGLLIIISPILIIINALKMMQGNKGFLKKWIGLFLYLLFFNVVIKLLYEVLAGVEIYSIIEKPWYVAIVHVVITLITIFSIFMMYKLFLKKKKK